MIKNIKYLKDFGSFRNYKNTDAKDFTKYNLFYGWNGSGKSTLVDLFHCIEKRTILTDFISSDFSVSTYAANTITQKNVSNSYLNIRTFNQRFIQENIAWDDLVKSILLIGDIKIEERHRLAKLQEEYEASSKLYDDVDKKLKGIESDISSFETNSAKRIKDSFQSIATKDSYYMNYDKRKFKRVVDRNIDTNNFSNFLLSEERIVELTNAAKPDQKAVISFVPQPKNSETFIRAQERLGNLLKTSVISKTIQRLADNDDIKSWVENGLALHGHHGKKTCEFCGNSITEERIKQLEEHFNDDYKDLQNRLIVAAGWLNDQYIKLLQLPAENDFYDEFKQEYRKASTELEETIKILNNEILIWQSALKNKIENPFATNINIEAIREFSIECFNAAIAAIISIVDKHNQKSNNFEEETKKAKEQLELHYAFTAVIHFGYHNKKEEIRKLEQSCNNLNKDISDLKAKVSAIENSMLDEGLGAEKFNDSLRRFLGRGDLTLRFNKEKRGYEILRDNSSRVSGRLSEGEKTAIAFVYFITKLRENNNKIEDSIIVVDDPISSFDSNHIFHAYSFLRSNCKEAKQLFILTHNFTFFKLIRDWIMNEKSSSDQKAANLYVVEVDNNTPRMSNYVNAKKILSEYNSEYHYIFSQLNSLIKRQALEVNEYFLAANLARKLLEAFLSFKFPKSRGNFHRECSPKDR